MYENLRGYDDSAGIALTVKQGKAETYIRSIRNANKKAYARAYWAWIVGGEHGESPDRTSLSSMGAQA